MKVKDLRQWIDEHPDIDEFDVEFDLSNQRIFLIIGVRVLEHSRKVELF